MSFAAIAGVSRPNTVAEPGVPSQRALRVLVVEDEPVVRVVVTEYLHLDGHTVETATNGREGLEKFLESWYDVVITDRAMPELNGDQLAIMIKKMAPRKPVIIMLTGYGNFMRAAEELPEGVDFVLSKPVSISQLRAILAKATELAS